MRRHLCLGILLSVAVLIAGCRSNKEPALGLVPANGFMKQWGANLNLREDAVERLFLTEGTVFAYTRNNRVYALSGSGGEMTGIMQVAPRGGIVRAPVVLGDKWIFPTLSTFEVYDQRGRLVRSITLDRATRGPAAGIASFLYIGLDYPGGGRLARIDITRSYGRTIWELLTFGGVATAPAVMEDAVYAATDDGRVFAVSHEQASPIWGIEGNVFRTSGPIKADMKTDEASLYVACMDSKLYCLDRASGRIRWTYYSGTPLRTSPVVTPTTVYQQVPGKGLVAIDKLAGKDVREPMWVSSGIKMFLSIDEKNVYALGRDNSIVALDKQTGEAKFRTSRKDFDTFAPNPTGATIYAATRRGELIAIQPVLKPGAMGQIVMALPN